MPSLTFARSGTLLGLAFSFSLQAADVPSAAPTGCLEHHFREAMELNRQRAKLYEEQSQGRSRWVSRRLLAFEHLGLPLVALRLDHQAEPYRKAGVPLLCEEVMPMSGAPAFGAKLSPVPVSKYRKPNGARFREALHMAYQQGGFSAVSDLAHEELRIISKAPRFNCLYRHMLESILRAAALAPRQIARAQRAGLPSPAEVSWSFIRSHLQPGALVQIEGIDRAAAPLQAAGVPIICNDVPQIPEPAPAPEDFTPSGAHTK